MNFRIEPGPFFILAKPAEASGCIRVATAMVAVDGTDKDPLQRWLFMFNMSSVFSLDEKGDP